MSGSGGFHVFNSVCFLVREIVAHLAREQSCALKTLLVIRRAGSSHLARPFQGLAQKHDVALIVLEGAARTLHGLRKAHVSKPCTGLNLCTFSGVRQKLAREAHPKPKPLLTIADSQVLALHNVPRISC